MTDTNVWYYSGDINIEYGGVYYRLTDFDYTEVVEVMPVSDGGAQDNAWWVTEGVVPVLDPRSMRYGNAMKCIGASPSLQPGDELRHVEFYAAYAWMGVEPDHVVVVQIGPDNGDAREHVSPHIELDEGADLSSWVEQRFNITLGSGNHE